MRCMGSSNCNNNLGFLSTAFWLVIVFAVFIIVPVLIASWIAERVYPLPDGSRNGNALGDLIDKRATLTTWLTAGFLMVIIIAGLLIN